MAALFVFGLPVWVPMFLEELIDLKRKSIKALATAPNGDTFDITYSAEKATVDDMARLRTLVTTETPEEDAVRHMIVLFGVTWNLQTKDAEGNTVDIPVTFDGMKNVSMVVLGLVVKAIQNDMNPKATSVDDSAPTSSTTA